MFAKRYPPEELIEIISAQSYSPEIVSYVKKVEHQPTLEKFLANKPKLGITGTIAKDYVESSTPNATPYISTKQVKGLHAYIDDAKYISKEADIEWEKCRVEDGDIVINKSGDVGAAAVLCCHPYKYANSVSDIISIKLSKEAQIDRDFLVVFLNSPYGQKQLQRLSGGAIFSHVSLHAIPHINVFTANVLAQKYIGSKVRQAERLTAFSINLELDANKLFQTDFQWDSTVLSVTLFNRLRADELENRLDLKFNSPHRLAAIRHAKSVGANLQQLDQLVEISAMIGWKGLTTEHYTDFGPWLLRGVEFNKGVIRTEDLVCVDEDKFLEQPQIHLAEGDVAFTKDGTIGKAVVIPRLPNRIAAGSTVARLRKKPTSNLDSYYLEFVLGHEFVQCQVASFATGVAQPHITQEWIALIKIPRVNSEETIASGWKNHHDCLNAAKLLIVSAKQLMEALIEGQLDESLLIAAQDQLQTGNDNLDRSILNRLKTDGVDGKGQPLFADLDQLYSLLEQAERS